MVGEVGRDLGHSLMDSESAESLERAPPNNRLRIGQAGEEPLNKSGSPASRMWQTASIAHIRGRVGSLASARIAARAGRYASGCRTDSAIAATRTMMFDEL